MADPRLGSALLCCLAAAGLKLVLQPLLLLQPWNVIWRQCNAAADVLLASIDVGVARACGLQEALFVKGQCSRNCEVVGVSRPAVAWLQKQRLQDDKRQPACGYLCRSSVQQRKAAAPSSLHVLRVTFPWVLGRDVARRTLAVRASAL